MSALSVPSVPRLYPGTRLLGEILTWSCAGLEVQHAELTVALRDCSLEESVARQLLPRHAFARACRQLARQRIIRALGEDAETITFQFTQEARSEDRFEYRLETLLSLDKTTGTVSCDLPGLASLAQELLDHHIATRSGNDLTRVIQRLFEREADLFPIRPQGGAYFVPAEHKAFTDRVQRLVERLKGSLWRFPVPAGTSEGDRSVREAVASGIEALITENREAVASFGEDTRPSTLERAAERIRTVRHKLSAYVEYLGGERVRLEMALSEAAQELRERVACISATD